MKRYIDYKCTTWNRIIVNDDTKTDEEIIEHLKQFDNPIDTGFDFLENSEQENILETEEYITAAENDNQSTIEFYKEENFIIHRQILFENYVEK